MVTQYTYNNLVAKSILKRLQRFLPRDGGDMGETDAVKTIGRTTDNMGRRTFITSYNSLTVDPGNIINEVKWTYGTHSKISQSDQDHSNGVASGSSHLTVLYAYDEHVDGTSTDVYDRGLRPRRVTYPSGRKIHSTYDSGSVADALSRVDMLEADNGSDAPGTDLVAYSYNGARRLVSSDYKQPALKLDLFRGNSGTYAGLDRFGRTIEQYWYFYTGGTSDRDRFKHSYDYASNRLTDDIEDDFFVGYDYLDYKYEYDGLHRLKEWQQGSITGGTFSDLNWKEVWTLDQQGNWSELKYGNNSQWWLDQDRVHNEANEIDTDITHGDPDNSITTATGTNWPDPVYDAAGNMTTMPQPESENPASIFTLKYDAWNRLIKVWDYWGNQVMTVTHNCCESLIVQLDFLGLPAFAAKAKADLRTADRHVPIPQGCHSI